MPPITERDYQKADGDERSHQKIIVVVQGNCATERHDREDVQREYVDVSHKSVVKRRIRNGKDDPQRAQDLQGQGGVRRSVIGARSK